MISHAAIAGSNLFKETLQQTASYFPWLTKLLGLNQHAVGVTIGASIAALFLISFVSSIIPGLEIAACLTFGKVGKDRGFYTSLGHNGIELVLFLTMSAGLILFRNQLLGVLDFFVHPLGIIILCAIFLYFMFVLLRDVFGELHEQFFGSRSTLERIVAQSEQNAELVTLSKDTAHITRTYCFFYGMFIGLCNVYTWGYLLMLTFVTSQVMQNHAFGLYFIIGAVLAHSAYDVFQCSMVAVFSNTVLDPKYAKGNTWFSRMMMIIQIVVFTVFLLLIFYLMWETLKVLALNVVQFLGLT